MGVQFSTTIEDLESGLGLMIAIDDDDWRSRGRFAQYLWAPCGPPYRSILALRRASA